MLIINVRTDAEKEGMMKVFYQDEKKGLFVNGLATQDTIILKVRQLKEMTEVRKGQNIYAVFITGLLIGIVIEVTSRGIRYTTSKPSDFKLQIIFDHKEG